MNTEAKDHADQSRRTWQSTLDAESRYRANIAEAKARRERDLGPLESALTQALGLATGNDDRSAIARNLIQQARRVAGGGQ